jgi:hypothetical protein
MQMEKQTMTKDQIIEQFNVAFYTMADVAAQNMPIPTDDDPETDDYIAELEDNYRYAANKFKKAITALKGNGKWVKVKNGRGGHECSICHAYAPSYQNGEEHLSRFCPNCGSSMVKED